MNDLLATLENHLQKLAMGNEPANLYEPIRYMLSLGGKRLRPLLVLMGYGLAKEDVERMIDPALAVEVFHNFTLMHDDIMDLAPLRRGKPTVHEKWNNTVAILSGDTMMVKAYDLLLKTPAEQVKAAIGKFNKCAIEVCEGQQLDMDFEKLETVNEDQYIHMIRLKTAVLLGFSLEYGGLLAGMDEKQQRQLQQVGERAGIGFQLMDDLLDIYADQDKFGKQVGGDIISNKKTFLLIKALALANAGQKKELDQWLLAPKFDPEEKVQAVKAIYEEMGIGQRTTDKMNGYYDQALALLNDMEVREPGKKSLIGFFERLMKRER